VKDVIKKTPNYFINDELAPLEDIFLDLTFDRTALIASQLMSLYEQQQFSKVVVVYNSFINAASQSIEVEQFLPLISPIPENNSNSIDYLFEPNKQELVSVLIPKSLKIQLFKALLDSNASEHGARMTAMHKATDNAKDLQKSLKLTYNKARQAAITNEILEIVGGAEALNG
jgi:F-type H+-transporting ATPase subunit gamma